MAFFVASAALAVVGIGTSVVGGIMGGKAQKEALKVQQAQQNLQVQRERYQTIRQARKERAAIVQAGANTGSSESSSVQTGAGNVQSQGFGNLEYINNQKQLGLQMSAARQDLINAQGIQSIGSGMTQLGSLGMGYSGDLNSIFKTKGTIFDEGKS